MIYVPVDWGYFVGDIDIEPQKILKETETVEFLNGSLWNVIDVFF